MDNPNLALELPRRLQDTWKAFLASEDPSAPEVARLTQENVARLREIIRTYGWPGVRLVGEAGATAAVYLVVFRTVDLDFKRRCLSLMLAAGPQEVPSRLVASLADLISVADGNPPIYGVLYGTDAYDENGPHPFGREWLTDDRRAKVSLTLFFALFPGLARLLKERGEPTEV